MLVREAFALEDTAPMVGGNGGGFEDIVDVSAFGSQGLERAIGGPKAFVDNRESLGAFLRFPPAFILDLVFVALGKEHVGVSFVHLGFFMER